MPIRMQNAHRWAQRAEVKVQEVEFYPLIRRRRVRARNTLTMQDCPVCGRFTCPYLHDHNVCAAKNGVRLSDVRGRV